MNTAQEIKTFSAKTLGWSAGFHGASENDNPFLDGSPTKSKNWELERKIGFALFKKKMEEIING